jgi:hypothetical protein
VVWVRATVGYRVRQLGVKGWFSVWARVWVGVRFGIRVRVGCALRLVQELWVKCMVRL